MTDEQPLEKKENADRAARIAKKVEELTRKPDSVIRPLAGDVMPGPADENVTVIYDKTDIIKKRTKKGGATFLRERSLGRLIDKRAIERKREFIEIDAATGAVTSKRIPFNRAVRHVIDGLATLIVRSKSDAFVQLRELKPMTPQEVVAYEKLADDDLIHIQTTDREIMRALHLGKNLRGWEVHEAMWALLAFCVRFKQEKILYDDKGRLMNIHGTISPMRFFRNLKVDYTEKVMTRRKDITDKDHLREHKYDLWFGSYGIIFLSNLINHRFLVERSEIVLKLDTEASDLLWRILEPFANSGNIQERTLEQIEGALGMKGTGAKATKSHKEEIARGLNKLKKLGLIFDFKILGRGQETYYHMWFKKNNKYRPNLRRL